MKYIYLLLVIALPLASTGQLPKGTIISTPDDLKRGDTTKIGDSAWHYVGNGFNYQWDVLKSTKKYPFGEWVAVGRIIKSNKHPFYKPPQKSISWEEVGGLKVNICDSLPPIGFTSIIRLGSCFVYGFIFDSTNILGKTIKP